MKSISKLIFEERHGSSPKVIFMAGGAGSGKSTILKQLNLKGMEILDPDEAFERQMEKDGVDFDLASRDAKYQDLKAQIVQAQEAEDEEALASLLAQKEELRAIISKEKMAFYASQKQLKDKQQELLDVGSDFIVDGTGGDNRKVAALKRRLEAAGYQTAMIHILVPLEVSLHRNRNRPRKLPDAAVERSWKKSAANAELYSKLFGKNYFQIQSPLPDDEVRTVVSNVQSFLREGVMFEQVQKVVKANAGDVSEGILGAAVAARFLMPDGVVDATAIWRVIQELNKAKNTSPGVSVTKTKTFTRPHGKTRKSDKITLTVGLATNNFAGLMDPKFFASISGIVNAAASFASNPRLLKIAKTIAANPKENNIVISSIGLEDQKGTKVDLKILVDGTPISLGALSLKAGGTKQLGQIGQGWAAPKPGASRGIFDLFKALFGIELSNQKRKQYESALQTAEYAKINQAIDAVYYECFEQVGSKFDTNEPREIANFIVGLAKAIKYEAMLEEEGVILVHLNAGTFKALNFEQFVKMAMDETVEMDIEIEYRPPANWTSSVPYLFINMSVNGSDFGTLISIRPKIRVEEGVKVKEFRHYVQKEAGLAKMIALDLTQEEE